MYASESLQGLPAWALVALGALAVLQVALDVIALIDLARRPVEQVEMANKWVWVAIILVVSTFGAIVYFIAGRKAGPVDEVAPAVPAARRAENAADVLYGARKDVDSE